MEEEFYESITKLCIGHFKNLPKTGKPTSNQWTVLSCIVKQNESHFEVVSLGTGSKCIGKNKMSPKGDILNDSHAEVICRRAFLRYIYDQLNPQSEIFVYDPQILKYSLKSTVRFHFFTTQVPCGDAAIFPKQDSNEFGTILLNPKRPAESDNNPKIKQVKLDIFRTGAKCVPEESRQDLFINGPQYHTTGAVRTKPGRGDPTLSLSCSDKLAKWGYLGIQGALLSLLIKDPIRFSSFSIAGGTPFCEKSLTRALWGRFQSFEFLEAQKICLGQALTNFAFSKDDTKQPCPSSIAWCKVNSLSVEVAVDGKKQGVTKKKINTKAGRLEITKIELYRSFINVIQKLKLPLFGDKEPEEVSYHEAKTLANEYQTRWEVLKRNGFKAWSVKDKMLKDFVID